ncbi:MAG: sulfotransferase [Opitutales bacterium]
MPLQPLSRFQTLKESIRRNLLNRFGQDEFRALSRQINVVRAGVAQRNVRKPLTYTVDCDLPLIYVSEPPRSGGTLLRSLLDGHPACHVFPHEISWEKNGFRWASGFPAGASPRAIFARLRDQWTDHFFVNGIDRLYPFYFNRSLQRKVFLERTSREGFPGTVRAYLGAYLTSFFNAWVDYQNLYKPDRQYVCAFCPWPVETTPEQVESFFKVYPDGYRLQVLRHPMGWWASFRNFHLAANEPQRKVAEHFPERWKRAAEIGLQMAERYPDRYLILSFDDLVRNPEASLQALCKRLELPFADSLRTPSINEIPKRSNSSYSEGTYGFDPEVLERWRSVLSAEEISEVDALSKDLYEPLRARAVNHGLASE